MAWVWKCWQGIALDRRWRCERVIEQSTGNILLREWKVGVKLNSNRKGGVVNLFDPEPRALRWKHAKKFAERVTKRKEIIGDVLQPCVVPWFVYFSSFSTYFKTRSTHEWNLIMWNERERRIVACKAGDSGKPNEIRDSHIASSRCCWFSPSDRFQLYAEKPILRNVIAKLLSSLPATLKSKKQATGPLRRTRVQRANPFREFYAQLIPFKLNATEVSCHNNSVGLLLIKAPKQENETSALRAESLKAAGER